MKLRLLTPILLAFGCASSAMTGAASAQGRAEPTGAPARALAACNSMYFSGAAPVVTGGSRLSLFCHVIYVSGYSITRRNPLWVAQRLTREDMERGDNVFRADQSTFAPEPTLTADQQAADRDFEHNDWDKGHMAPANDAPDEPSQLDTFFLSNAVPQHSGLNRFMWAYLEGSVHRLAALHGEVFVVTGPIFGSRPDLMNNRVPIPASTYKAIYIPSLRIAAGFIATNGATPTCRIVSIAVLARESGVNPFPRLPARVRSARPTITLPNGVIVRRDGGRTRQALPDCRAAP